MVTASGHIAAREPQRQNEPDHVARAALLATAFAERAPLHDRDGSFPFQNFDDLSKAGLLALTVPAALGGGGAGAAEAARILGIIGKADPSTALVLSMHYIQHLVMARSSRWPARLSRKLARETVEGVALINALRVEPELGSPARGGLPATIARRTETGWRLSGRKIYSTGAPILKWYAVWARTDEAETRVGMFLVPAGLPGTRIIETWDHLGLRASGSHDVIFEDVVFPLDHEIDVRLSGRVADARLHPGDGRMPSSSPRSTTASPARPATGWSAFSGTASRPISARRWRPCRGRRKCSAASRRGLR